MAMHGYKLQKDRTKGIEFYDIEETLAYFKEQRLTPAGQSIHTNNTLNNE